MKSKMGVCFWVMFFLGIIDLLGCARVRVEGPEEPIKVDITMRVDVYQHVQEDINAIEDIVAGQEGAVAPGPQSWLVSPVCAWAEQSLDPKVEEAALRRKERLSLLQMLESEGIIGENKSGLLEVRAGGMITPDAQILLEEENKDRMTIYTALASKNNVGVSEIQSLYAQRLQTDAPAGTPIETDDGWQVK